MSQEKEKKVSGLERNKVKLSLFADNVILFIKCPKEHTYTYTHIHTDTQLQGHKDTKSIYKNS